MNTKVVVIGSNSFSGSDFIDLLLEKKTYDVIGISRSHEKQPVFLPYKRYKNTSFRFYKIDINAQFETVEKILLRFRPDYVINFAGLIEVASSWEYPHDYLETNTVAMSRLIAFLAKSSFLRRYVHISSAEVYGSCHNTREDAPISPSSPYAVSKAAVDLLLLAYKKVTKFPFVIVRSTNVYGAHQQLFRIVPKSIVSIKKHTRIPLQGGGVSVKSYIHIRDISRGELAIMKRGRNGEIYHLSPDTGISIRSLITSICDGMNVRFSDSVEIVKDRVGGQDAEYTIDSSKARREFGWKPTITIHDGVRDVIDWVDANWAVLENLPMQYIHQK